MLSRQRQRCENLAIATREDRDALALAQARLGRRVRAQVATPSGIAACFIAGLLVGRLALAGRRASQTDEEAGAREARPAGARSGAANAGLLALRLLELLTKL